MREISQRRNLVLSKVCTWGNAIELKGSHTLVAQLPNSQVALLFGNRSRTLECYQSLPINMELKLSLEVKGCTVLLCRVGKSMVDLIPYSLII